MNETNPQILTKEEQKFLENQEEKLNNLLSNFETLDKDTSKNMEDYMSFSQPKDLENYNEKIAGKIKQFLQNVKEKEESKQN